MNNTLGIISLSALLLFAVSAMAQTKVVVIPLGGKNPTGDAVAADVLEVKTFSNKDDVGIVGTMVDFSGNSAKVYTPGDSVRPIDTGYHAGSTVATDADLESGNIRRGITIFGVNGKSTVVDTYNASATASHIIEERTAWVNGIQIVGTMNPPACDWLEFCGRNLNFCTFKSDDYARDNGYAKLGRFRILV